MSDDDLPPRHDDIPDPNEPEPAVDGRTGEVHDDEFDQAFDEDEFDEEFDEDDDEDLEFGFGGPGPLPAPPQPIIWDILTPEQAETDWFTLNQWVHWLRRSYGLPASVVPPFWHLHKELVLELSALHLHWCGAYAPTQSGSAPLAWHADFAAARERLREWVSTSGTKLSTDRPTRQTVWPGEPDAPELSETRIENREQHFLAFVIEDVTRRRELLAEFHARIAEEEL